MPEFLCRVATPGGDVFERTYTAENESGLRRDLDSQDLMILDVKRQSPLLGGLARLFRMRGSVSPREFLIYNQQFGALINAGLPILTALEILTERGKNQAFKEALTDIRERVKGGEALSDAFAAQGEMFPTLYSSSLASGERSGELGSVVQRFVDYQHRVLMIRSKVISAMIYPAVLVTLSVALIALMIFYIIPKFKEFMNTMSVEMPFITRFTLGVADFAVANWMYIAGVAVGLPIAFLTWQRTERGRLAFDAFKLRIPLIGMVVDLYAQNRFTRTLGTLQAGGIPLVTSLDLSARAVGNRLFEKSLLEATEKVREGSSLHESLAETGLISDISVQMVKVGESTGALVEMLAHASDFTDNEIENTLTRLVALIEPLMLVFMALIVAFMLLTIYMPLFTAIGEGGA